jgi:hypothetical protein
VPTHSSVSSRIRLVYFSSIHGRFALHCATHPTYLEYAKRYHNGSLGGEPKKHVLLKRLRNAITLLNVQLGEEVLCGVYFPPRNPSCSEQDFGGLAYVEVINTLHMNDLSEKIGFSNACAAAVFYSKLKRTTQQNG